MFRFLFRMAHFESHISVGYAMHFESKYACVVVEFPHMFRARVSNQCGPSRWSVRVVQDKIVPYGMALCTKKQHNLKAGESEKLSSP